MRLHTEISKTKNIVHSVSSFRRLAAPQGSTPLLLKPATRDDP